jgi:hypothetical protein
MGWRDQHTFREDGTDHAWPNPHVDDDDDDMATTRQSPPRELEIWMCLPIISIRQTRHRAHRDYTNASNSRK